jgi:hypothetical protein
MENEEKEDGNLDDEEDEGAQEDENPEAGHNSRADD